jgi:hypothetical protein
LKFLTKQRGKEGSWSAEACIEDEDVSWYC